MGFFTLSGVGEEASHATEKVSILADSGNTGIGTTVPAEKLSVNGNMRLQTGTNPVRIQYLNSTSAYSLGSSGGASISFHDVSGSQEISFETHHSGSSHAERVRISKEGHLLVGTTDPSPVGSSDKGTSFNADGLAYFARLGGTVMVVTRNTNDGTLLDFRQAGTQEGTISVSGTTISYNGGHLSRWSQLADNTRDNTIVKGTVMTNLDQMAEWTADGITEDNEQLNCMAVSSVEGDANVAGVFVNWDDDDDIYTNDMNIAMTGDMVIRIAQGTTVARGDLLMSAGDGTAKPQGDDIVRSKTIAKVTSTNVSHTYDDGTYLVPCVLMAC